MVKIFLSVLLLILGGCGSGDVMIDQGEKNPSSAFADTQPEQTDIQSENTIQKRTQTDMMHVVAGDDQQVIAGSSVVLYASNVDKNSTIVSYTWKEGDVILSTEKEAVLETLDPGIHQIVLEAVASDGEVFSDIVMVEVKPPMKENHLPKANDLLFTTPEDTVFNGALRGSDEDGDFLKYLLVSLPEHGTLSGSPAHLHYTPDPDFFGEDKFYFKTNDGKIDSPLATVTIQVEPRNDAPVVKALHETMYEDATLQLTLKGTDKEGDSLHFLLTTLPKYGSATITGDQLVYIPKKGFSGRETFSYKANDGMTDSKEENITIDVMHINHIPTVVPISVQTDEDKEIIVTLQGEDSDLQDSLAYRIVTSAVLGNVRIVDNKLYYTPFPNQNGIEKLQYVVSDGYAESDPAEISITIRSVNDVPRIDAFALETDEDIPKTVTLQVDDPDGDNVTFHISQQPLHGIVTVKQSQLTYIPDVNYHGNDRFSYYADDGISYSQSAIVDVLVRAVNDFPVANDLSYSVMQGEQVDIVLKGSDIDSTTLTYFHESPQHGMLSGSGKNLTYTPDDGFTGTDFFEYWISDGIADSERKRVSITVSQQPNNAPVVTDKTITLLEDSSKTFTLSGSDADGDTLTFSIVDMPSHGTLTISGDTLYYTPDRDFFGNDRLTYMANDSKAGSNIATILLTVDAVNDAPIAFAQRINVLEDAPYTFTLQAQDVENDVLTYVLDTLPQYGSIVCNADVCRYTPSSNFIGNDMFTFHVNDGLLDSSTVQVDITVTAANDAPVAVSKTYTLQEDTNLTFTLESSDVDNDTLSYLIVTQPSHGVVRLTGNTVLYQPEVNYFGTDTFSFKVNDGTADSNTADINLTVEAVNDLPVVQNGSVTLEEDTTKAITLTGSDIDGDTLTFEITQQPVHGTLSGIVPNLVYTPDANFNGSDLFKYIAKDSIGSSNEATVLLHVTAVNDLPVAEAGDSIVAPEGVTFTLSARNSYDPDGTIVAYEWIEGTTPLSDSEEFTYTFTDVGIHTITLIVTDDSGATATDTLTITVEVRPQVFFTRLNAIGYPSQEITALFTKDIDNDGDLDIIYAKGSSSQEIGWYKNNGNLNFTYMGNIITGVSAQVITMGDINNDDYPDLVYGKDALYICTNNQNSNFVCDGKGISFGLLKDDNIKAVTIADIDMDGKNDIVISREESSYKAFENEITALLQADNDSFSTNDGEYILIDASITDVTSIAVEDNDNDGDNDLLVSTSTSGVYYYNNNRGTFTRNSLHNTSSSYVYFTDVNHDQKYDAIAIDSTSETVQWDELSNSVFIDPFVNETSIDLDLDGYSDIVPTFSGSQTVVWYHNNADSSNTAFNMQNIDYMNNNEIRVEKVADIDNDGDQEIIVGTKSGEIFIYRNDLH